jgi:hypothetical protein
MGVVTAVARKKGSPGRKPDPEGPREGLITLKCRMAYKEWLLRMADELRTTPAAVIDLALAEFAKARKLENPPKR